MTGREIFARDDHLTIDLNLMNNQLTCLNASITLSRLPIMMQTQLQATNIRWGEMTVKSLQPCLVPMPNTFICHNWLSHYNCLTEMWWPNLDDWKRNIAREACPTIDLILIRNQSTCIEKGNPKNNNRIRQHEKTNPSFNSSSPFPLSTPFFLKQSPLKLSLLSILMTASKECGQPSPPPCSLQQRQWQRRFFMIPWTSSGGCMQIIFTSLCSLTTSTSN